MQRTIAAALTGFLIGIALMASQRQPVPSDALGKHAAPRSGQWTTVRKHHLQGYPACEVCGAETNVEVHHVEPFHEHPEKELDPDNLITLCRNPSCMSHLTLGHLGSYKRSNPHIREDAAILSKRRKDAK